MPKGVWGDIAKILISGRKYGLSSDEERGVSSRRVGLILSFSGDEGRGDQPRRRPLGGEKKRCQGGRATDDLSWEFGGGRRLGGVKIVRIMGGSPLLHDRRVGKVVEGGQVEKQGSRCCAARGTGGRIKVEAGGGDFLVNVFRWGKIKITARLGGRIGLQDGPRKKDEGNRLTTS